MSSHRIGRCRTISIGSVSAAMMTSSAFPRFSAFVASFAPFLTRPWFAACSTSDSSFACSSFGASGLIGLGVLAASLYV